MKEKFLDFDQLIEEYPIIMCLGWTEEFIEEMIEENFIDGYFTPDMDQLFVKENSFLEFLAGIHLAMERTLLEKTIFRFNLN